MEILKIYKDDASELRCVCKNVTQFDEGLAELASSMWATMEIAGGCGLAANQVGLAENIICVNHEQFRGVMVNPTWSPDEKLFFKDVERCLSVPGIQARRSRYVTINVNYFTLKGVKRSIMLNGFAARIVQHECDHLNGILMTDEVDDEN